MKRSHFLTLLGRGEELYRLLLESTVATARNICSVDTEDLARFMGQREEILTGIQIFDSELARCLAENGAAGDSIGNEPAGRFRELREETTRKILDADAVIISVLKERMAEAEKDLKNLSSGRKALMGYENGNQSSHSLIEGSV